MRLGSFDVLKDGAQQAVGNSATNTVVSDAFILPCPEASLNLVFQVTAASVSGTGAVCKLQHSIDGTNFSDVDATNAKVTITGNGRFLLQFSATSSNFASKVPLGKYIRFVCTTGGSDAVTFTRILVQVPTH